MPEPQTESQKPKGVPLCCIGCIRWEKFGKNCDYYWEGKKRCTMWIDSWFEAPL